METAIEMYSGVEENDCRTEYDLSKFSRPVGFGTVARFTRLQFVGKQRAKYFNCEYMKVKISVFAHSPLTGCHIAFVVKNKSNTDKLLSGMSKEFNLHEGNNDILVEIPLELLISDTYMLHVEVISFHENGISYTYDNPFSSFLFVVEEKNGKYIWPKKYYGNIRVNDVAAQWDN